MYNIKRVPHIIATKRKTVLPSNFLFFDTETKLEGTRHKQGLGKHVLWFGFAYARTREGKKYVREKWFRFTTQDQFFEIVKSRVLSNRPLYVYAHNLGFDLTIVGFFQHAKRHGFEIQFYSIDSPPTIFKCKFNGQTVVFVDTLNYWTTPLKELAKSIGLKKLEMPKDTDTKQAWDEYGKNDVVIIAEAVDKLCQFAEQHKCGAIGHTLASMSMNAYRHNHMKYDIYIHDRIKICEMEREAYYGGYVNAFFIGRAPKQQYSKLDITSHYPNVMLGNFPTKLIEDTEKMSVEQLGSRLKRYSVIAEVLINSKTQAFPKRVDGKLCYVVGRYSTTLSTPELRRAIDTKSILKVKRAAIYNHAPIFSSFVKYFWRVRREYIQAGKKVDAFFCKILLNSLYGKFGQRGAAWVELNEWIFEKIREKYNLDEKREVYTSENIPFEIVGYQSWTPTGCEETFQLRNLMDNTQIKLPISEHNESFPAIAAHVTAYGREHLLRLVYAAGSNHVYYCDTDSLFVDPTGLKCLKALGEVEEGVLGKLKLEDTTNRLEIRGLKDYTFGDSEKIKGIRAKHEKLGPNQYKQIRFEGLRGVIRRGGESYIEIDEVNKTLKRVYDKGVVGKDGWTRPLRLDEF